MQQDVHQFGEDQLLQLHILRIKEGHGPAWANSLFEDNAEYGFGMFLGVKAIRERIAEEAEAAIAANDSAKAALQDWLDNVDEGEGTRERADKLVAALEKSGTEAAKAILAEKDYFVKRSQWIFGGDGWAYDIGYGGVDHVLAIWRRCKYICI